MQIRRSKRGWMYNKGDLVYVPSETLLYDSEPNNGVKKFIRLDKPEVFLFLEERSDHLVVQKRGSRWLVKKDFTYKVGEKNVN